MQVLYVESSLQSRFVHVVFENASRLHELMFFTIQAWAVSEEESPSKCKDSEGKKVAFEFQCLGKDRVFVDTRQADQPQGRVGFRVSGLGSKQNHIQAVFTQADLLAN